MKQSCYNTYTSTGWGKPTVTESHIGRIDQWDKTADKLKNFRLKVDKTKESSVPAPKITRNSRHCDPLISI